MNRPTNKKMVFVKLARWYVRRRLGRAFENVFVRGIEPFRAALRHGPVLLCSNHVSFWDPLVLLHFDAQLEGDGYCLMDENNLEKLPFFSWVGALPLHRGDPKRAYVQLARAATLLDLPGRYLVVFAQGEQRPAHLPLDYKPGIFFLARKGSPPVFPMALRYDFHESDRALVHISVGPALGAGGLSREEFLNQLSNCTRQQLDHIDDHLLGKDNGFVSLLGRTSDVASRSLPAGTELLARLAASKVTDLPSGGGEAWHRK